MTDAISLLAPLLGAMQLVERELLVFAAFWFLVGAVDELTVDIVWLWLRLRGNLAELRVSNSVAGMPLGGRAAVLIPAWRESRVIGATIAHTLSAWPQDRLTLYIGCYRNDPATIAAALEAAGGDSRLRLVIHDRGGPTTKADCLNRLYAALSADEVRTGVRFASIVLHDAEDMVHPVALPLIDLALAGVDFVQLPVRPEPQPGSRYIAGHYGEEFAEAHGKTMVVRDALGAGLPAAGVGCGFAREALARLATTRGGDGPFAAESLTEDYELGLLISRGGGKSRFLRVRDANGGLVATRSYFPPSLEEAVRQKARWVHGIAFQGWDRLGWGGRPVDVWMAWRDRRGPMIAVVLTAAYCLLLIEGVLGLARLAGWRGSLELSPELQVMLPLCFASLMWRAAWRFAFTAREYGWMEGLRSLVRLPVANVIAILAGRRALIAYLGALRGELLSWDKTEHTDHPARSGQSTHRAGAVA